MRYLILTLIIALSSCEKAKQSEDNTRTAEIVGYDEFTERYDQLSDGDTAYFSVHWPVLREELLHTIDSKGVEYYSYDERKNMHWSLMFFVAFHSDEVSQKYTESLNEVLELLEFTGVDEDMDVAIDIRKFMVEEQRKKDEK